MKPIKRLLLAAGLLLFPHMPCAAAAPEPLPAPVVWNTVGTGAVDSMPIGNGEIALNVWSEPNGDVVFYIARTDAWDENGRLLKLGRIRLSASPALDVGDGNFRQTLNLRDGRISIHAGTGAQAADLDIAVDVNHPVVRIGMKSSTPRKLKATLEIWRKERRWVEEAGMTCWYMAGSYEAIGMKVFSDGDVISEGSPDRLLWYHRNEESQWEFGLRHQGIFEAAKGLKDPLIRRTFGGIVAGNGFRAISPTELESDAQKSLDLLVCLHTAQTDSPEAWQAQAAEALEQASKDAGWSAAHTRWWHDFWDRSYVRISQAPLPTQPFAQQTETPLRWGADSAGASRFTGYFGGLRLWSRALAEDEVKAAQAGNLPSDKSVDGEWLAKDFQDGSLPDKSARGQPMKAVGEVISDNFADRPALLLNGNGFLEGGGGPLPAIDGPCSWECWFAPEEFLPGGSRLIDKIPAATDTGFLLDTYPGGDGLRLLSRQGSMEKPAVLQLNTWHHVAVVYDGQIRRIYLDGELLAADPDVPAVQDFAERLNLTYNLQRWISACAGRGQYPIKFNGSLFTIEPAPINGTGLDPDFRQWGGEYWWQNTRLMYYPMLASGDFDLMKPLFAMYRAQLDLMKARTKTWYGVQGAAMCEAGTFWGMWSNYDYGWKRPEGLPVGEMTNRFMWHYWFSGLELTWLMLEYYDHTNDRQFLEETLLPMAEQFLLYFDQRFPRDAHGRLRIYPSQALETWQDAENPVTDIAGLKAVLDRLTKLPQLPPGLRERWLKLQGEIPPIPLGQDAGRTVVVAAERPLEPAKNIENPELYPVFPFRQFSLGKDQFPIGLATYAARKNRAGLGWSQDGMQAAALGLREETAGILIRNLDRAHPKFRLPVFWGPNYDWLPDQCHGGNFLNTLQMMLLQSDGDRILVAPAWPKDWEGGFKLHAARNTIVEGQIANGRITRLEVTPQDRAKDIVPGLPMKNIQ